MVRGLGIFIDHFKNQTEKFAIIGGTACFLAMQNLGLEFRATKDIDIILFAERLDASFVRNFWEFIGKGGYEVKEKDMVKRQLHRFSNPRNAEFPSLIELFSCHPDSLEDKNSYHLTPISVSNSKSSLSAILLDADYYQFIHEGIHKIKEIPIIRPEYLIPLKMKAWLDLNKLKGKERVNIHSNDIRKHKNDVFRLIQILDPEVKLIIPEKIGSDIKEFIEIVALEEVDLKALKINKKSFAELNEILKEFFQVN